MKKNRKHNKPKRKQPKKRFKSIKKVNTTNKSFESQMRSMGKKLLRIFKNKEGIDAIIKEHIDIIEGYFKEYDCIKLLGGIGLYLLDNLPNPEKYFMACGNDLKLDDTAEIIAEYAMNFGLALPNSNKKNPTDTIILDLRIRLKTLLMIYLYLDMPLEQNHMQSIDWLIHMETIIVRGDGYQEHVYNVFNEMFDPHTDFFQRKYGYSVKQLFEFLIDLRSRVICKIGDGNNLFGASEMHKRWKKWETIKYGTNELEKRDWSKGLFGEFFENNPDVAHTEDGMQFILFPPSDFIHSDSIFWIYPQNDIEEAILNSLSMSFGENASFLTSKTYKGNIMNGHSIFERPFIKDGDKYYCFTPMIPQRNLFLIGEKLMMRDSSYYQQNFLQNSSPISRDNYIERKVKSVMESFLPSVKFYSSVHYKIYEDGIEKKPELDILGVSCKATYIIEVKAHELTHKDRVGLKGAKDKFQSSVIEACTQCLRSYRFIIDTETPRFGTKESEIIIDKTKPIYKIAVTFQHYSAILGQMDKLESAGMIEPQLRDTWITSLFDLMVISEFIESEDEFITYLEMRKTINTNPITFHDELDLLGQFLNEDLASKIRPNKPMMIVGGANYIDEEYTSDSYLPINIVK